MISLSTTIIKIGQQVFMDSMAAGEEFSQEKVIQEVGVRRHRI